MGTKDSENNNLLFEGVYDIQQSGVPPKGKWLFGQPSARGFSFRGRVNPVVGRQKTNTTEERRSKKSEMSFPKRQEGRHSRESYLGLTAGK